MTARGPARERSTARKILRPPRPSDRRSRVDFAMLRAARERASASVPLWDTADETPLSHFVGALSRRERAISSHRLRL